MAVQGVIQVGACGCQLLVACSCQSVWICCRDVAVMMTPKYIRAFHATANVLCLCTTCGGGGRFSAADVRHTTNKDRYGRTSPRVYRSRECSILGLRSLCSVLYVLLGLGSGCVPSDLKVVSALVCEQMVGDAYMCRQCLRLV